MFTASYFIWPLRRNRIAVRGGLDGADGLPSIRDFA
jgi:hypothetical protein